MAAVAVPLIEVGVEVASSIISKLKAGGVAQEILDAAQAGLAGFQKAQQAALTLAEAESLRVNPDNPPTP